MPRLGTPVKTAGWMNRGRAVNCTRRWQDVQSSVQYDGGAAERGGLVGERVEAAQHFGQRGYFKYVRVTDWQQFLLSALWWIRPTVPEIAQYKTGSGRCDPAVTPTPMCSLAGCRMLDVDDPALLDSAKRSAVLVCLLHHGLHSPLCSV